MVRSVTSCAEVTSAFGVYYEARGSFPFSGCFGCRVTALVYYVILALYKLSSQP